jgi:hypothetical protein
MTFSVEVENKFEMAQRDIHVRLKQWDETLEEHKVSYPVNGGQERKTVNVDLGASNGGEDYLEICVDNGQADLGPCNIDLPAHVPFTFLPEGTGSITVIPPENGTNITSLKIPSGLPAWKLEVMSPPEPVLPVGYQGMASKGDDGGANNVSVGDDEPGGGG